MKDDKADNKVQLRYSGKLLRHWYWCVLLLLLLLILTAVILYIDTFAGCIVGGFSLVLYVTVFALDFYYKPKVLLELIDFSQRFGGVEKDLLDAMMIPYGFVLPDGRIAWMNQMLCEMTKRGRDCHKNISSVFPELTTACFPKEEEEIQKEIDYGDRKYRVVMKRVQLQDVLEDMDIAELEGSKCNVIGLHFLDITELTYLKKENFEQKPVLGLLYVDNYEEAMDSVEDVRRSMLGALVDRRITKYVISAGGLIKNLEKDKYLLVMNRVSLNSLVEDRFSILEDIKTVNLGNSLNVTISIGIGTDNGNYSENFEAAHVAIEMALARGGDQAVVKDQNKISYFGGKTQRSESNTRVRARVKAQALRELIGARERVIVMGHKNTDIDSLGASVGVCSAAMRSGKPVHIVLSEMTAGIRPWVSMLKDNLEYAEDVFVTHEQAIQLTNQDTVVVVVDTNRPNMVECEELLYLTKTIVVLDHHRQGTEKIENAALSYIDPAVSSACEMITEILQYYDDGVRLKPYEADCIYAGIIIDTNNFVTKTGMRTFEAAAYLRRNGADVTRVRKAFRNDMATYKARAEAVRHAESFMDSYAITVCPSQGLESPTVVGAQAANELLNIIGVKASFVLTDYNDKIYISARAIDEVNVQIIMERMGGGGHMNIAGAQLTGVDIDQARVMLKEVLTQMTKEGAI
ncbi:MAG: DHH family phosphoesterase [Lachnospiraceae bacterium]|nr:DHH family phosphoesterase [Lachnospiraceae bacterium]